MSASGAFAPAYVRRLPDGRIHLHIVTTRTRHNPLYYITKHDRLSEGLPFALPFAKLGRAFKAWNTEAARKIVQRLADQTGKAHHLYYFGSDHPDDAHGEFLFTVYPNKRRKRGGAA